jgi:2-polyprenyl-3-methyl-5-hydroxy-6-metoxy-1,4-benzoquinol methylase
VTDDLASTYGTFPIVISLEVIEHCASARAFMSTFASLLEPGGLGILSTPYHGYLKNLAVIASGKFDHHFDPLWDGGHLKFFSDAKLGALLDEYGFVERTLQHAGRFMPFAKSVIAVVRR